MPSGAVQTWKTFSTPRVYFHNPSVQHNYRANKFVVLKRRFNEMVVAPAIVIGLLLYFGKGAVFAWGGGFFTACLFGFTLNWIQMKVFKSTLMKQKTAEQRQADMTRARNNRR